MTNKELVQWLRESAYESLDDRLLAADKLERMEFALRQLAECHLTEENCASLELASHQVHLPVDQWITVQATIHLGLLGPPG
jgi:hypothetical protein